MLTLVESISLAGDRAKQNDDACGFDIGRAWVIDGATDLYDDPVMGAASDAAWLAHACNALLHASTETDGRATLAAAAAVLGARYRAMAGAEQPTWRRPAASIIYAQEARDGLQVVDLGDSRLFALDATGASFAAGGDGESAAKESANARKILGTGNDAPPLKRADVLDELRRRQINRNIPGGFWVFGVDPECAAHARETLLLLARPAHILLCTDGFSALTDRYGAYDVGGIVQAAATNGLQALGRELRQIETADAAGAAHPRWKRSDDATAMLLRLT